MPMSIIKVYFNNGCTTLKFTDFTKAEEIIRVVIKGRLSLNELRFKQCFQLRSTKFSIPFKDFDPDNSDGNCSASQIKRIEKFFWLKNNVLIKDWLKMIENTDEKSSATDFWKLQLRVRSLSSDLNEIQFKDPVTFGYFYEQIKNDFNLYVAPNITDPDLIPILLDLGCLEMRRAFQNMHPNVLDKKINFEYLEKDVGLKRFFPELVLQQKAKNLKKMIVKGLKSYESWNEVDCMLKFLEKLKNIWKYNEESYKCHLGITWNVPIVVLVSYDSGIVFRMNKSEEEVNQTTKFTDIIQIITELDENQTNGILKLKISDAKELLIFKFSDLREAENLASLIDIYCILSQKRQSLWSNRTEKSNRSSNASESSENRKSSEKSFTDESIDSKRVHREKRKNFALILNENDQLASSESPNENYLEAKIENLVATELNKCDRIQIGNLVFYEKLGSGQFGEVYRGTYKKKELNDLDVAIKILKNKDEYEEDSSEKDLVFMRFVREAKMMQNFDHPHIIKLIGVCVNDSLSIIMELAKFGQLRTYLQNNKNQIETKTLLLYCLQLNSAMEYLESKKYVHRDIAARNILVFSHECLKLADFGLSREVNENFYLASKCKLPIKWMAPESINFRKFTSQSDIWMFGICIWEIMSFGDKPFQGIKNADVIKLIEDKKRLEKPKACPNELYVQMLQCWEYDSSLRPNFTQLKNSINLIYSQYREKKELQSLSTASSLKSDLSLSSNLSLHSNTSSLLSVTMTISRHRSPRLEPVAKEHKTLSPPPKPSRFNLNKFSDFSPIRSEQKKNYPLFINNDNSSNLSQLLNKIEICGKHNTSNESPSKDNQTKKEVSSNFDASSSTNDLVLRDLTLKFIHNISIFIKLLNGESRQNLDSKLKEIIQSMENLIEAIFSVEVFKSSRVVSEQVDELEKCLNTLVYELKMNRTEKVINCSLEMARNANELFLTLAKQKS